MKWIFWVIWCILCIIGIILDILFFVLTWLIIQLWEFKYRKFTWNYWIKTEYNWKCNDKNPLDTYIRWITFK